MKIDSFLWHDTKVISHPASQNWNMKLFHGCMRALRQIGFSVGPDPFVERYKSLQKSHRHGNWKECEFAANYYPNGFEIEFYQNVVAENPNGGRFDFNKNRKMPHMIRLRYKLARRAITEYLRSRGIDEEVTEEQLTGLAFIRFRILNSGHFRGGDPFIDWKPEHRVDGGRNGMDANGVWINPGERKFFYSHAGHLSSGIAYYNMNNMWWLHCPEIQNVAAFDLFDWSPGLPRRRKDPKRQVKRIERELSAKADAMDFERCILLRNELQKLKQIA